MKKIIEEINYLENKMKHVALGSIVYMVCMFIILCCVFIYYML